MIIPYNDDIEDIEYEDPDNLFSDCIGEEEFSKNA